MDYLKGRVGYCTLSFLHYDQIVQKHQHQTVHLQSDQGSTHFLSDLNIDDYSDNNNNNNHNNNKIIIIIINIIMMTQIIKVIKITIK